MRMGCFLPSLEYLLGFPEDFIYSQRQVCALCMSSLVSLRSFAFW